MILLIQLSIMRVREIEIIREKLNNHLINHIYDSNIHEAQKITLPANMSRGFLVNAKFTIYYYIFVVLPHLLC